MTTAIVGVQRNDTGAPDVERDAMEYVLHAIRGARAIVFERADNAKLWDIHGKEYLDTMSGSAGPAMVGHANPHVAAAVSKQMARLPSHNLRHDSVPVVEYCKRLAQIAPAGLSKSFLCPGGGDAIEAAVKFAIRVTGRPQVLSLVGAYHGMSFGALALGGMPALRSWFPPDMRWPNFRQVASADCYRPQLGDGSADDWRLAARALENDLSTQGAGKVAALIMELVQGPNGHAVFPQDYYAEVQSVCRKRGVLLIVDEIQTGLGRCGALWACDHYRVQPDILVAGKALGGGVPIGVFITRKDLIPVGMESEPWHYVTFMNQPLAASAGLAVLDVVKNEKLVERARQLGEQATLRFREM
ncbi:MAG: aspartate aminotransferase family protein, partial [Steroidobacteraceae bacterium]